MKIKCEEYFYLVNITYILGTNNTIKKRGLIMQVYSS